MHVSYTHLRTLTFYCPGSQSTTLQNPVACRITHITNLSLRGYPNRAVRKNQLRSCNLRPTLYFPLPPLSTALTPAHLLQISLHHIQCGPRRLSGHGHIIQHNVYMPLMRSIPPGLRFTISTFFVRSISHLRLPCAGIPFIRLAV